MSLEITEQEQNVHFDDNQYKEVVMESPVNLTCIVCNSTFNFSEGHHCNDDATLTIVSASVTNK